MSHRILVVEDDPAIGAGLSHALREAGYEVFWAKDGVSAVRAVNKTAVDLVVLDLGLPDMDGIEVCRRLREHPKLVIVMLTARRDEMDVVMGLDAGADDYLVKPFRLVELLARLRAHLRRPGGSPGERIVVGPLEVDRSSRIARLSGDELELRPKEFDLLAMLAAEAGRTLSRERIMAEVWDEHWFGSTKTLDMHVSWLRRKLTDHGMPSDQIATVRGVGYRFEAA
jgi:DNA-binding response OmpR family regulator